MGSDGGWGQDAHLAMVATEKRAAAGELLALGVDPGSRGNCGWALVAAVPGQPGGRVLAGGVVPAHGGEIRYRVTTATLHQGKPDVFAWERPLGKFYHALVALNRTVGRWLAVVEEQWPGLLATLEVEALRWQDRYVGNLRTPRLIVDEVTGEKRKPTDADKAVAKQRREETYRDAAVRVLGLEADAKSDVAAAAWVAKWAIDHMPATKPAKRRRK